MEITGTVRYIGVNDHQIDLFEGQYAVPEGMAYNSYVILDSKIAVLDSVDRNFTHEWLDNLERELKGRKPDYLIVQHMEPDHSASIAAFCKSYPQATVVASSKAFPMMNLRHSSSHCASMETLVSSKTKSGMSEGILCFRMANAFRWMMVRR